MSVYLIGSWCVLAAIFNSMHKDNFFVQKTQRGNNELEIACKGTIT